MMRYGLVAGVLACVISGLFTFTGYAGQSQSVTQGVYSTSQATRGQEIYNAQCAECHGKALEGAIGPPLAGGAFLSNWSGRSLANLVEKTQKTMPFNLPGSLSSQQTKDLVAYILQMGKFPAGATELSDVTSPQITFPVTARNASSSGPAPEGNLAELMRAIAFPNSNIIFNLQLKDPGKQPKKDVASSPFDYVDWGATIYPGWLAVDQAAVAIVETAPLLLTPGRKCQNGRLAPVDREDWKKYVADLIDVGKVARQTAKDRNYDAFMDVADKLNTACANCHKVYRDKGGTEGSGGNRCE
jgi:mono/diheme cytochrome c family protein